MASTSTVHDTPIELRDGAENSVPPNNGAAYGSEAIAAASAPRALRAVRPRLTPPAPPPTGWK
jgi:hypothetical protein